MDIGDIGYLIFLVIVAVANLLRNARKKKDTTHPDAEPQRKRSSSGRPRIPRPVETDGDAQNERSRSGERETQRGGTYAPAREREVASPEAPADKEDHWRRMMEEMFGEVADEDETEMDTGGPYTRPAPRPSPAPSAAAPVLESVRADGYREGESLTAFAERIRREGRIKLSKRHLEADEDQRFREGLDFRFELRDAVIYDAIFRPPYL